MLARRLPSVLPPMSTAEALEVTKIYSVAGLLHAEAGIVATRPFRAPHHTISQVALAGGGGVPKPGEISLAHHGVLFLDEVAEFGRTALETMRQPLEEGVVTIGRAAGTFAYPARFALDRLDEPVSLRVSRNAHQRLSLRRRDGRALRRQALGPACSTASTCTSKSTRVGFDEMLARAAGEPSAAIRARVEAARTLQIERYRNTQIFTNAGVPGKDVRRYCTLGTDAAALLRDAAARGHLSARALDRVARVARTIADLAGSPTIDAAHVAEAITYRSFERKGIAA